MAKKWKAVATFRYTHDKVVSFTGDFEDFADIEAWLEAEYDVRALEQLIITFNADDERMTLAQLSGGRWSPVQPPEEPKEIAHDQPH